MDLSQRKGKSLETSLRLVSISKLGRDRTSDQDSVRNEEETVEEDDSAVVIEQAW